MVAGILRSRGRSHRSLKDSRNWRASGFDVSFSPVDIRAEMVRPLSREGRAYQDAGLGVTRRDDPPWKETRARGRREDLSPLSTGLHLSSEGLDTLPETLPILERDSCEPREEGRA